MDLDFNKKATVLILAISIIVGSLFNLTKNFFFHKEAIPLKDKGAPALIKAIPAKERRALSTTKENKITVHITGQVKNPGVYIVKGSTKLYQLIAIAGGELETADLSLVNLAKNIGDGEKISIPTKAFYKSPENKSVADKKEIDSDSQTVNINNATIEELDKLPGVGLSTAKNIVKNRPYGSLEDLLKINRFGKKKLDSLRPMLCV